LQFTFNSVRKRFHLEQGLISTGKRCPSVGFCFAEIGILAVLSWKTAWDIIADNLSKAGWSLGYVSAIDFNGRTIWIADAHRGVESGSLCVRMKS
jgi:hypothetical protein